MDSCLISRQTAHHNLNMMHPRFSWNEAYLQLRQYKCRLTTLVTAANSLFAEQSCTHEL